MLTLRVPATSANLGPGFDCLGLALDLWNEVTFEPADEVRYEVRGEGAEVLNGQRQNLLIAAFERAAQIAGKKLGAIIRARNEIPPGSGLGSSAAAIVAGLWGASELLGQPFSPLELLHLATQIEGHADNVAPALLGGLTVSALLADEVIVQRYVVPEMSLVLVQPQVHWPTQVARSVLPASVPRHDVVFNLGRVALVIEALRNGDLPLLQKVMEDRLHQPYRLPHIPGGLEAFERARRFGAAALSGAGPSLIVFTSPAQAPAARESLIAAFAQEGVNARGWVLRPSLQGAHRV
ncbi:MAG: homoserine kinase [Anaerolineae bacterium]